METFNFGKYKGQKIDDVIKVNPEYVDWAQKNVKWFELDDKQKDFLSEKLSNSSAGRNRHSSSFCSYSHEDYDQGSMFGSHQLEIDTFGFQDYGSW